MTGGVRVCEPASEFPHADKLMARGFSVTTADGVLEVIVVKQGGDLAVYENACPHTGVVLNWLPDQFLDVEGELLQCATHGALFDPLGGTCLRGPCAGQALRRLRSRLIDGVLYLDV